MNISFKKPSGHATNIILAEFCVEMFHGGKWQLQHYFSFIFGVVAQFFNLIAPFIFPPEREGRISRL